MTAAICAQGTESYYRMADCDTALMEALRDGDEQAMVGLVTRYQDELVGYFYHHCWDQTVAEELAETVFVRVFQARNRYRATARVRTYLYRIAHNIWIDHLRRLRPNVSLDAETSDGFRLGDVLAAPPVAVDDDDEQDRGDTRARIQTAVEALPQGQRDVFILANSQDMKYQDIARVLDIPEGTVKSRMHAAVRNLRKQLADLVE